MVAFSVTRGGEYLITAELPQETSHVERMIFRSCRAPSAPDRSRADPSRGWRAMASHPETEEEDVS